MFRENYKSPYKFLLCGAETEQGVAQAIIRAVVDFKRDPWPRVVHENEGYQTGPWSMRSSLSGATLLVWPQAEETLLINMVTVYLLI